MEKISIYFANIKIFLYLPVDYSPIIFWNKNKFINGQLSNEVKIETG